MHRIARALLKSSTHIELRACSLRKTVRIYGRKGWLRILDGYEEKHIIMDKELR